MNERADAEGITSPTIRFMYRLEDDYKLDSEQRRYVFGVISSLEEVDEDIARETLLTCILPLYGFDVYEEALAQWRRWRWDRTKQRRHVAPNPSMYSVANSGFNWSVTSDNPFFNCSSRTLIFYLVFLFFAILFSGAFGIMGVILIFVIRRVFRYVVNPYDSNVPIGQGAALIFLSWFLQFLVLMFMFFTVRYGLIYNLEY